MPRNDLSFVLYAGLGFTVSCSICGYEVAENLFHHRMQVHALTPSLSLSADFIDGSHLNGATTLAQTIFMRMKAHLACIAALFWFKPSVCDSLSKQLSFCPFQHRLRHRLLLHLVICYKFRRYSCNV